MFAALVAFAGFSSVPSLTAYGLTLTIRNGPPSLGGGGPNPLAIPPVSPVGYEFCFTTRRSYDLSLGITPGLFWGRRFVSRRGTYLSTGGGLVIGLNGTGPGIYTAFGFDWCSKSKYCFNMEYKKAIGLAFGRRYLISPYALRVGFKFEIW